MEAILPLSKELIDPYIEFKYLVDSERFKRPVRLSKDRVQQLYQKRLFGDQTFTYVYVSNNVILGELRITIEKTKCHIVLIDMKRDSYLSDIFTALIDKAIEVCKEYKHNKITTDIVFDDKIQVTAYTRHKFKYLKRNDNIELWDTYVLTL